MEITVRKENSSNIKEVYEINRLAFGQENEARLVNLLRSSNAFIPELSLVAGFGDKLVGHILFSKIVIVDKNRKEAESLALAPMAVIPEFQQKGIGRRLVKSGLDKAKELNYKSVIVLGHEHYYPRFGFLPADRWHIQAPFDVPANVFMALELIPNGLEGISGTVKYPKEFEAV